MDYRARYVKFLKSLLSPEADVRAVCDASDGAAGPLLPLLSSSSFKILPLHAKPNGRFPAHGPDPWKPGATDELAKSVRGAKADFGAIYDADGDRAFFLDDRGRPLESEAAAILLAQDSKPPYLIDLRMGWLLKRNPKFPFVESRVGHTFIKRLMEARRLSLGVEFSGHYYFAWRFGRRRSYFDSALRATVHMANAVSRLKHRGLSLSAWRASLPRYARIPETNFRVTNKEKAMRLLEKKFSAKAHKIFRLDGLTMEFADHWFNVRPSNTEPFLRLNLEARDEKILNRELARAEKIIKRG